MSGLPQPALAPRIIPLFRPSIGEAEIDSVVGVLRSGWLTAGPHVTQFECAFAQFVGARHAIAVNSATSALQLALEALGVCSRDEVLVPAMTFAAAAAVVIHLGARPVFVDCCPTTLRMDPDDLERRITSRSKVVMPMHYAGQPCEMDRILDIARRHGLMIVEDAAHALPAEYGGLKIGSIGEITCFSFYANKTITTGEGGMVTTANDGLAAHMRRMSYHGISRDCRTTTGAARSWCYEVVAPGYKFNMSDVAAAVGIHQLDRCNQFRESRNRCAQRYHSAMTSLESVEAPRVMPGISHAWHLYVIQLDLETLRIGRDKLSDLLNERGIGTSVHYLPLHMQSYYRKTFGYRPEDLPSAAAAYKRILSLPIFPSLEDQDIDYTVNILCSLLKKFRR